MEVIAGRISDRHILNWIKQWLSAAVVEEDQEGKRQTCKPKRGTPQGGVISPLLANIYLNLFDRKYRWYGRSTGLAAEPMFGRDHSRSAYFALSLTFIVLGATDNTVTAMAENGSAISEIQAAEAANTREFVIQTIATLVTALVLAYFAYCAWAANNRFQETLNRNAQARIAEATAEAAKANENVAKVEMQIANVTAETANAKKETLAVSLKLEAETIRRLDAERALLELIERVHPRRLNANQEAHVVESLKASPVRGQVRISYVSGDAEGGLLPDK
jgi:cell division protein FtsB